VKLFAGIDGGQSSTTSVIGDETGAILGRGRGGPADEVGQDASSTRLHDALREALQDAIANAGLDYGVQFEAIVAGISGYEGRVYGKSPELPTRTLSLLHDTSVAHAGALGGGAGIVVIAGTGSVAYGVDEKGATATIGGWGYLFGDEGSAFWIAREALAEAMRDEDRGIENPLRGRMMKYFEKASLREIARAFYTNRISRESIAAFATQALGVTMRGKAAAALARIAVLCAHRLQMQAPKIAVTGGLMKDAQLRDLTYERVRELLPPATLTQPQAEPAVGALMLARTSA
jgi:N-acetylglucosamine kinase-like BadF-type ATPase